MTFRGRRAGAHGGLDMRGDGKMGGGDGEIEPFPIKVRGQQLMMERISSPLVFFIMSQDLLLGSRHRHHSLDSPQHHTRQR